MILSLPNLSALGDRLSSQPPVLRINFIYDYKSRAGVLMQNINHHIGDSPNDLSFLVNSYVIIQ